MTTLYDTPQKLVQGAFDSKQQVALQRLFQNFLDSAVEPLTDNIDSDVAALDVRVDALEVLANTGTDPGVGVTIAEAGDSYNHVTTLTLANFAVGTSGDNANLALGGLVYTFPAGGIIVDAVVVSVGLTLADAIQTDTPELGLGTTQASGAHATLGAAGAGTENLFEGTATANVSGTALTGTKQPTGTTALLILPASAHTVYLNAADGWADITAASAVTATGTVKIFWRYVA